MSKAQDLTNLRFGRLTVIKDVGRSKDRQILWLCKCDCGNEKIVRAGNLKNGHIRSCGCLQQESRKIHSVTHGLSKTRIYKIYLGMKKRCYNKNYIQFDLYGGRGITICNEWLSDFINFYEWSMNNGYNDTLSIDRIDYNGNYCPENCRWATTKEQNLNTRKNRFITFNNETHTLKEWAEICHLSYRALQHRLDRKWSIERALTTPLKVTGNQV